ncbi:unnamed protein product [Cylicocyclus nassatus]|uniref:Uncharacterized protein n=1 Tax=Cylicocyclus nassatus TaxID=53992 RepID=A0AA36GX10_CYLNA|nr:unnamed protein product [Cylicocyclus nassatus]
MNTPIWVLVATLFAGCIMARDFPIVVGKLSLLIQLERLFQVLPTTIHGFYKAGYCSENDPGLKDENAIAERPNGTELNNFNLRLQKIFNDDIANLMDLPDSLVFSCELANAIADENIKPSLKRRLYFTTYTRYGNVSSVQDLITITFTGETAETLDAKLRPKWYKIFQSKKPKTYAFGCNYFIVKNYGETTCAFQKKNLAKI